LRAEGLSSRKESFAITRRSPQTTLRRDNVLSLCIDLRNLIGGVRRNPKHLRQG
jgi:hypothetical protein